MIPWTSAGQDPDASNSTYNWTAAPGAREAHPINGVDWWIAQEFCVWDGGRLPTEAEWEYAARGRSVAGLIAGRGYPWGETAPSTTCDRAQWNDCAGDNGGRTRRVGSFAASAGLYDLAGNVWEWTADNAGVYPSCRTSMINPLCYNNATADRVFRGGSYLNIGLGYYLRSATRNSFTPTFRTSDIGIRCARTR